MGPYTEKCSQEQPCMAREAWRNSLWSSWTEMWNISLWIILRSCKHLGLLIILFCLEDLAVHQHGEDQTEHLYNKNADAKDPHRRNITLNPLLHFLVARLCPPSAGVALAGCTVLCATRVRDSTAIPHFQPVSVILHSTATELSLHYVPSVR